METRPIILTFLLSLIHQVESQARPLPVTWASTSFGPDGPWQAVSIGVGSAQGVSTVALYPGGSFDSNIFVTDYCNGTTNGCAAATAGLYDVGDSPTSDYRSIGAPGSFTGWRANEPMNMTGQGIFTLDTMKIASSSTAFLIEDAVFSSVISSNIQMPNGSSYPSWVGNLALGSPNPVQTFLGNNGTNVTGQLLTGNLKQQNSIPSSSFGLHIGSANLNQEGSLILGGYDQARVVGPIASYDTVGVSGEPIVSMVDVTIGVQTGGTPFNVTRIPSLYSAGNNRSTSVSLNPLVPYMSLPPATCAAIASWLPVTYIPSIGLYTWNTKDYRYKTILSSPAYLGFTFKQSDNSNLTIKVPFSLLNLTLESPIVASSTQYFPCHPWTSPSAVWHLGRAFMQAAYLSINWEQNKFFVGQATGPGLGPSSIQTINSGDTTIRSGDIGGFQESWSGVWTVLPANTSSSGSTEDESSSGGDNGGLSQGAKIGIGVGVGVGAILIIGLLIFFLLSRRKRRQRERDEAEAASAAAAAATAAKEQEARHQAQYGEKAYQFGEPPPDHKHPYHGAYGSAQYRHEMAVPPGELDAPNAIHEAPQTQRTVHEAPTSDFAHEIDSTEVGTSPRSARTDRSALYSSSGSSGRGSSRPLVSAMTRDGRPTPTTNTPTSAISPDTPRTSPRGGMI